MAANGGRHFEINIKTENYKTQFISQKHANSCTFDKYDVSFYATNHFVWLFYEYCSFIRHYWKKFNILCEPVTSQPH